MTDRAIVPAGAPVRLVIFDFDGTLCDSGDWFTTVVNDLAKLFRFRPVRDDEVEMLRHLSAREVIAFLGIARWKMPFLAWYVRRLVGRNVGQIQLFPGMPDMLEQLRAMGLRIALVTSNSEDNARRILGPDNAGRIEYFACGSSLFGKAPKFRKTLKELGVAANEAVAIGDETRDVDAAREVGMRAGSVLWGYNTEDVLVRMKPDALFREPQDILDYVAAHR